MVFFSCFVYELLMGLAEVTSSEADVKIKSKIQLVQMMAVICECRYLDGCLFPVFDSAASEAVAAVPVGYCVSDIISECGVELSIY